MTVHHIKTWIAQNKNAKPESVIMFRDGVSEGQLAPVVHEEVAAIKGSFLFFSLLPSQLD